MKHDLLTLPEVSEHLRVSRSAIYTLFARGELKPTKIGRRTLVSRRELERFMLCITGDA